ncbi:MAG: hypothetical protein J5685_03080 [Clostridiales bacterium]|nr:hypothetical protein [Clostridiales bacterium]
MENLTEQITGEAPAQEIKSNYNIAPETKELIKRLDTLETINHAFWIMLSQKGYTDSEFDAAIDQVLQLGKKKDYKLVGVRCPGCGKNAQVSGSFKIKCIYCGMEAVIHPYEMYEMARDAEEEEERQKQQELAEQPAYYDPNAQFTPYDVSKDLNFDEEQ